MIFHTVDNAVVEFSNLVPVASLTVNPSFLYK